MSGVRIFETKRFATFAAENDIEDEQLIKAVEEIEAGKADANLGGGVYKQRVARKGHGKSGSFRTILLFRAGDKAFFVDGFAKSRMSNITLKAKDNYKRMAKRFLSMTEAEITTALSDSRMRRIR